MDPRQLATVKAALNLWQIRNIRPAAAALAFEKIEDIAGEHGPALDAEEMVVGYFENCTLCINKA